MDSYRDTCVTVDMEAERRLSIEEESRTGSFSRQSTASRGTFNKKNLSILLPEDEPGTDYNPNFKTPVDAKPLGHQPAIRPVFIQKSAVDTQPKSLKPATPVPVDNNSDISGSSEDLPNINRALHGSHSTPNQYSGSNSASSAPVSVGSAPVSVGSAPSGSNSSERKLKPSETTIEIMQHNESASDDGSDEPHLVEDDDDF